MKSVRTVAAHNSPFIPTKTIGSKKIKKLNLRAALTNPRLTPTSQLTLAGQRVATSVGDLAIMLELDLLLSNKKDFTRRLIKALNAAYALGVAGE